MLLAAPGLPLHKAPVLTAKQVGAASAGRLLLASGRTERPGAGSGRQRLLLADGSHRSQAAHQPAPPMPPCPPAPPTSQLPAGRLAHGCHLRAAAEPAGGAPHAQAVSTHQAAAHARPRPRLALAAPRRQPVAGLAVGAAAGPRSLAAAGGGGCRRGGNSSCSGCVGQWREQRRRRRWQRGGGCRGASSGAGATVVFGGCLGGAGALPLAVPPAR